MPPVGSPQPPCQPRALTAHMTQNKKRDFLSNLADWLYAGFALVANEFLLEVFVGLCWSIG
jgi:hypothetical protein